MKDRLVSEPRLCECGDHCFVSLTRGYMTVLDPEDAHIATSGALWAAIKPKNAYAMIGRTVGRKTMNTRLHREIMKAPAGMEVDHKNGNGLDNRKRWLRLATTAQNQKNTRSRTGSVSKYLGVSFDKRRGKWKACIQSNLVPRTIGRFSNEVEAAQAYDEWAIKLHGEFASLNFPNT